MAIVFFSMAMFGHQAWSTMVQTLTADMFPSGTVASVAGLAGSVGTYGAMLFSLLASYLFTHFGYTPAFILAGLLHPISFILVLVIIKKIELVKMKIDPSPKNQLVV
jgi:ACS family hexuronate transporter-like MFS transporter